MSKAKYWLTSSQFTNFEDLKMRPKDGHLADVNDCKSCLWFFPDEVIEAQTFYIGLKKWIYENYPFKERLLWLNKDWANDLNNCK